MKIWKYKQRKALLVLVCIISRKFSYLLHLFVFFLHVNQLLILVWFFFMLKDTQRKVRYYKSLSYNAFVISDVWNRSLCVIPFITGQKPRAYFTIQLDLIMVFWVFKSNAVLSTLPDNPETPDFEPYLPVSRLESEISRIIAKVYHFL